MGSPKLAWAEPTEQPRNIEDLEDGLAQVPPGDISGAAGVAEVLQSVQERQRPDRADA